MDFRDKLDRIFSFYFIPGIFLITSLLAFRQYYIDSQFLKIHYINVEGTLSDFFEVEKTYGDLFQHTDHYLHVRMKEYNAEFDLGLTKNHLDSVELARHSSIGEGVTAVIASFDSLRLLNTDTIYIYKLRTADGAEIKNDYRLMQSLNIRFTRNASLVICIFFLALALFVHFRNRRKWKPKYDL